MSELYIANAESTCYKKTVLYLTNNINN